MMEINGEQEKKYLQKSIILSSINSRYTEIIDSILSDPNSEVNPRGLKSKEALLTLIEFSPFLSIANFNERPFNFKYFLGEVSWYLQRDRKLDFISNFSSFWNNITNSDGTVNSNYGSILLGKQMNWVVNSLKKDKFTRQAIAYLGGKEYQYPGNKDFVCTQYLNFFIRGNKLHMKVQMRSNDLVFGVTYDAPWFSLIQQSVYLNLLTTYPDLEMGSYFHASDNTHFYERHYKTCENILTENPEESTIWRIALTEPLFWAKGIDDDDVEYSDSVNEFLKITKSLCTTKEDVSRLEREDFIGILNTIMSTSKLKISK